RAPMREHGRGGAARDEFLEMAAVSMALHGRSGVGAGVHYFPGRAPSGIGLKNGAVSLYKSGHSGVYPVNGCELRTTLVREPLRSESRRVDPLRPGAGIESQ